LTNLKIFGILEIIIMRNPKEKVLRVEGCVIESLPSIHFRVRLDDGREILAYLAGRLKLARIKILPGDKVTVEINSYDEKRGRIVYRGK